MPAVTRTVNITHTDIRTACGSHHAHNCPGARAIERAFPELCGQVFVKPTTINVSPSGVGMIRCYPAPLELITFVRKYDNSTFCDYRDVLPTSFNLTLELP